MAKIVLISCVSKKLSCKSKAKDLYISSLFKFNLKYADSFFPDNIFILSAKYGLVSLDDIIDPYDMTLNNMNSKEIKLWADNVLVKLSKIADLKNDEFIFLAGDNYRKYLISSINNYKIPLKGLGIGKQLHYLKEKTKNV
ncbi:hypothetical protein J4476_03395 [Candidatus Woesearchaeota archaeon]|nr:MAG: hypothetical protein QT09_C0006G0010 [archaeon GW2011_AR18]MBS3161713.1 hypothetical protein [Candidatus Woesearchaeota archaeon]HIH25724.1 hypothetical protein [Nanoarchaeota archaeon]